MAVGLRVLLGWRREGDRNCYGYDDQDSHCGSLHGRIRVSCCDL
jgi:hypothetical protein